MNWLARFAFGAWLQDEGTPRSDGLSGEQVLAKALEVSQRQRICLCRRRARWCSTTERQESLLTSL